MYAAWRRIPRCGYRSLLVEAGCKTTALKCSPFAIVPVDLLTISNKMFTRRWAGDPGDRGDVLPSRGVEGSGILGCAFLLFCSFQVRPSQLSFTQREDGVPGKQPEARGVWGREEVLRKAAAPVFPWWPW